MTTYSVVLNLLPHFTKALSVSFNVLSLSSISPAMRDLTGGPLGDNIHRGDGTPVRDMHRGETVERRKTFPTLDCANCILIPYMTSVGQHPYIQLMTYSEVVEVSDMSATSGPRSGRSRAASMRISAPAASTAWRCAPSKRWGRSGWTRGGLPGSLSQYVRDAAPALRYVAQRR